MGKYLKEKIENQKELRKQRKSFYQLFVVAWFFIALSVAMTKIFPSPKPGYWTITQLLTIIAGIVALIFTMKFFIQMKKVSNILYKKSNILFWLYLFLLIAGFATGFVWLIPLITIWLHSKKLLSIENSNKSSYNN